MRPVPALPASGAGKKSVEAELAILGLSEGAKFGPMIAASDPSIRAVAMMAPTVQRL